MKAVVLFALMVATGCAVSLERQADLLRSESSQIVPPANWREREWHFAINHRMGAEYSYRFKARFKENEFPYYSCLIRDPDDPWLELEIIELEDIHGIRKDLVAMYHQNGSYIEILMSGDICDVNTILMTKIEQDSISGFQTSQGWGHTSVIGTVNIEWK